MAAILASVPARVDDPDADAALAPLAAHAEAGEGADQPLLQRVDVAAHVARRHRAVRAGEVQHDIGHALAGAVIGPLPAAAGGEGGEAAGIGQLLRPGGGAGGVERRVLHQPDQFGRGAGADGGDAVLHAGHGIGVGGQALGDAPFRGRRRAIEAPSFIRYIPAPARAVVAEW